MYNKDIKIMQVLLILGFIVMLSKIPTKALVGFWELGKWGALLFSLAMLWAYIMWFINVFF
tara:strand:- start:263 stop:445 length:183 start_codon:yes stop_codon:yes gene_type:complete